MQRAQRKAEKKKLLNRKKRERAARAARGAKTPANVRTAEMVVAPVDAQVQVEVEYGIRGVTGEAMEDVEETQTAAAADA